MTITETIVRRRYGHHRVNPAEGYPPGSTLTAVAELYRIGEQRPYFSVTGEIGTYAQHRNGNVQACGCLHEEILRAWPELAPIVALHLSDEDGVPMHALENARYWAGLTQWEPMHADALARHLRITEEGEAEALTTEEAVAAKVAELAPRWKAEAEAAIAYLRS